MGGAYFSNSCLPKSLLFNLGVLSGILSAQILAASVTPFVSKTHIENSQCGWQSTKAPEKPTLFLVCSMILTYFSMLFVVIVTLRETWSSFFQYWQLNLMVPWTKLQTNSWKTSIKTWTNLEWKPEQVDRQALKKLPNELSNKLLDKQTLWHYF